MRTDENSLKESIARIDELVRKTEGLPDPSARALAAQLVQAVMELHATALTRMLEIVAATESAPETREAIISDDLVSSVLALHGLHPDNLETRVHRAVEKLSRYFDSRGAGIALLEVDSELVRVRFTGARPGSGAAAKELIEGAIYEAAPEVATLVIEGLEERREPGFVPLADLFATQQP